MVFGPRDRDIQNEILAGWAGAAREVGDLPTERIIAWFTRRRELVADQRAGMGVGHVDVFAIPKS